MTTWLTCTPRDFDGGVGFFVRDSGLLCRGFQALGVPCRAVMLGNARPDDDADLIRADAAQLESAAWWRGHGASGVVMYAWGRPEYTRVAQAIRAAGLFLILHQDSSGVVSPRADAAAWAALKWHLSGRHRLLRAPAFVAGMLRSYAGGRFGYEQGRLDHLRQAHMIGAVSPAAVDFYQKHLRSYGENGLAGRVRLMPHPVSLDCVVPDGQPKQERVICAGRWAAHWQKRPDILTQVLQRFLKETPEWTILVAGTATREMTAWRAVLADEERQRVEFAGELPHALLIEEMRRSCVCLCTSAYESFHITSAEMLCCGGTVVAVDSPLLSSFRWFAGDDDGTLADRLHSDALLAALKNECRTWDAGRRQPAQIAARWRARLHASSVAALALAEFANSSQQASD